MQNRTRPISNMPALRIWGLYLVCLVALGGCSQEIERISMSGTVSLDGVTVEDGQIAFEPLAGGKMEFGIIADGTYSVPKQYGLLPGDYLIRITGNRASGKQAVPDSFSEAGKGVSMEIFEQYIPPQFNVGSTLKLHVESVEHLQKDFSLSSE